MRIISPIGILLLIGWLCFKLFIQAMPVSYTAEYKAIQEGLAFKHIVMQSPEEVVAIYINAFQDLDVETMELHSSEASKTMLDPIREFMESQDQSQWIPESEKQVITPERVICTGDEFTMVCDVCFDEDNCEGNLNLIRVNNRWLLNVTKENMSKGQ
ncbi:MAG: hypothetical protein GY810_09150 [Aureispira sp.]|nr:hypothetical protein [Aureispira sp.]